MALVSCTRRLTVFLIASGLQRKRTGTLDTGTGRANNCRPKASRIQASSSGVHEESDKLNDESTDSQHAESLRYNRASVDIRLCQDIGVRQTNLLQKPCSYHTRIIQKGADMPFTLAVCARLLEQVVNV
jgi:hypothetical protein